MPDRPTVGRMSNPVEQAAAEARAALARLRITQTDLADRTGRSQTYWSRRLSGVMAMSLDDLNVISQVTGVPVTDLVSAA